MKINSRRQVFQKYGPTLRIFVDGKKKKTVELSIKKNLPRLSKFSINPQNPYDVTNWSLRTKRPLDAKCTICGALKIEMHHRRPLKAGKSDNTLRGIKEAQSRKQIPLCRSCHIKVHTGQYDGPGIY